ncbi:hypothetical protein [Halorubrum sp. LN27]|uniref:hypothetical protein n=1 Tax=Halorubrum sp. LN27 TaxID=2801032 RepID=UPI001909C8FF|nr:hypothetical protein [Halorubrum sp. LN27]
MRRRTFLRTGFTASLTVAVAGCSDNSAETPDNGPNETSVEPAENDTSVADETETDGETGAEDDESAVDRPDNYRWDLRPGRNVQLREALDQYVDRDVGGVVEDHPAFDYSTDSERDVHEIDFNALELYRESNFEVISRGTDAGPMGRMVEAFVDESIYEEHNEHFITSDQNEHSEYSPEAWLNADTVEESLDLAHNWLLTVDFFEAEGAGRPEERAVIMREAYKQHHDFDILAWTTSMEMGSRAGGLLYSPNDDKIRVFSQNPNPPTAGSGTKQLHPEIQDWRVIEDPDDESRAGGVDPTDFHHPALFHTDEWDRQGIGFEDAKRQAVGMINTISTETTASVPNHDYDKNEIAVTTGLTEQLTRTVLEYNQNDEAEFEELWNFANISEYLQTHSGSYVIDTATENSNYNNIFDGDIAVYEIDDSNTVEEIWNDQNGEYDNFGAVYDELEAV